MEIKPQLEAVVDEVQEILLHGLSAEEKKIILGLLKEISRNMIRANALEKDPGLCE